MPLLPFPDYAPDVTAIDTGVSPLIQGVVPRGDGYGPFKALTAFTTGLPAACRGIFFARRTDGSIAIFAGTSTNLYLLNNSDFSWGVVSRGGLAYPAITSTDNWQFVQFADTVLATQVNTVVQAFALSSATNFVDLAGSPPQASHIAVIGGFVVLSGLSSNSKRVQWSDLFGITTWTAGVGLSDFQDFPDGGTVQGVAGGDYYGVIFQDDRIRRMLYVPGSAAIFDFLVLSRNESLFGHYSPITVGDRVYFCSSLGFRVIQAGNAPTPIGKERIDRTFAADVDSGNLQLFLGVADPSSTRLFWAYKSGQGNAGLFDKILCFDPSIGKLGKWTTIPMSGEYLVSLAKPGLTLENLDSLAPGKLTITGAANNGSGAIRLTLNALSTSQFSLGSVATGPSQNFVEVYGVAGTTEANGSWPYTIVDSTHIDLTGSSFVHAYTSGGNIGGSLDALGFSMDDVSTSAISQLAAVNSGHMAGFFNGDNIEAVLETDEKENDGDMTFLTSVRPFTDSPDGLCSIASRNVMQAASVYSAETAIDTGQGQCPCLVEARYMRVRLRIPAASKWTFATGVQPDLQPGGEM